MATTAVKVVLGVVMGVSLGAFGGGGVAAVAGYLAVKRAERDARSGWSLAPAVVATHDLPAGARLTMDELHQRAIPERMLTASIVKPDSAPYVVNQVLQAPVRQGDPLWWGLLGATGKLADRDLGEACGAALEASALAPRRAQSPSEVRARLVAKGAQR